MRKMTCKMCDEMFDIQDDGIKQCPQCGYIMTLPSDVTDSRIHLYNRANHYRKKHHYDKAMMLYNKLLAKNPKDAEAHWGAVMCRFGVEYVSNVKDGKMVPVCHRTELSTIFCDKDYLAAIRYASIEARAIYKAEARFVDKMQKAMLKVSVQQSPYDIFICCRDSDDKEKRTVDSKIVEKLHTIFEGQGYRVFSHCVSLNEAGCSFVEPYIYNALYTSSVMIVVGTKIENFNHSWVVNEWGRFLAMASRGEEKYIIPVYRNMSPYELPVEFSHLDMVQMTSKTFVTKLSALVDDYMNFIKRHQAATMLNRVLSKGMAATRIDRVFDLLLNGDFIAAEQECDRILITNPDEAKAYIGKLMAQRSMRQEEELMDSTNSLSEYCDFQNALQCADSSYRDILLGYEHVVSDRIMKEENERIYQKALRLSKHCVSDRDYREVMKLYLRLGDYRDVKKRLLEMNKQHKKLSEKVV